MFSVGRRCCLGALSLFLPIMLSGQSLSPSRAPQPVSQVNRILPNADLATRAPLVGHMPRWATPANLVAGSVDSTAELRLTILLRRSAAAQQAFAQLLVDQQTLVRRSITTGYRQQRQARSLGRHRAMCKR